MVSKITEVTIFESPDGGRTVYARQPGNSSKSLHYQDPKLKQELEELEKELENVHGYSDILDDWERDQWYTFNRSGLFEKDDEENLSDITDWGQDDTRRYITEIEIENALRDISFRTLDEMRNN